MALKLRGRAGVAFEIEGEGVIITLAPSDPEDVLLRKLKRIVSLTEPEGSPLLLPGLAQGATLRGAIASAAMDEGEVGTRFMPRPEDAELLKEFPDTRLPPEEAEPAQPPGAVGQGRGPQVFSEPAIPAHLTGEWEAIPPQERDGWGDGNG